jgi:hypothetical protein
MRMRQVLYAVAAIASLSAGAHAQQVSSPNAPVAPAISDTAVVEGAPVASLMDRPSEAVRRPAMTPGAPLPAAGKNLGEAKAEMIVGGAAIVAGMVVGGDGGAVLMFGGAVVGLYGLWNYLK